MMLVAVVAMIQLLATLERNMWFAVPDIAAARANLLLYGRCHMSVPTRRILCPKKLRTERAREKAATTEILVFPQAPNLAKAALNDVEQSTSPQPSTLEACCA